MTTRPLSYTFDLPLGETRAPEAGDFLSTSRATYRITGARPIDSTIWHNRWRLYLERVGDRAIDDLTEAQRHRAFRPHLCSSVSELERTGSRVWRSKRYRRGETPASYFGQHPETEPAEPLEELTTP